MNVIDISPDFISECDWSETDKLQACIDRMIEENIYITCDPYPDCGVKHVEVIFKDEVFMNLNISNFSLSQMEELETCLNCLFDDLVYYELNYGYMIAVRFDFYKIGVKVINGIPYMIYETDIKEVS